MLTKLLSYLLWVEMVWVVFNWLSPWRLWGDADIIVACTLPWILFFFLVRHIRQRWQENHNAAIGCLYTALYISTPFIIAAQIFFAWLWSIRNDTEVRVYEGDKYRVTILYGIFTTNTDNIRIEEHYGPFHREVYYGYLCDIDTNKLNSSSAIEEFLKKEQ